MSSRRAYIMRPYLKIIEYVQRKGHNTRLYGTERFYRGEMSTKDSNKQVNKRTAKRNGVSKHESSVIAKSSKIQRHY